MIFDNKMHDLVVDRGKKCEAREEKFLFIEKLMRNGSAIRKNTFTGV